VWLPSLLWANRTLRPFKRLKCVPITPDPIGVEAHTVVLDLGAIAFLIDLGDDVLKLHD